MNKKARLGILIGIAAILFVVAMAGLQENSASGAPVSAAQDSKQSKQWTTIQSWKGSGSKTTESFEIRNAEWRINWRTTDEQIAGIFQIYVYDAAGNLINLAANKQGIGNDVSYVHAKAGRYYLTINSANVTWAVSVEDQR